MHSYEYSTVHGIVLVRMRTLSLFTPLNIEVRLHVRVTQSALFLLHQGYFHSRQKPI